MLPLDDSTVGRQAGAENRPPHPMAGRSSITLYPHMDGLNEKAAPKLFNRLFLLSTSLDVAPESAESDPCEGALLSLGGHFGGMALYLLEGVPVFEYSFFGRAHGRAEGSEPLAQGAHTVELEFAYDGAFPVRGAVLHHVRADLQRGTELPRARRERIELATH